MTCQCDYVNHPLPVLADITDVGSSATSFFTGTSVSGAGGSGCPATRTNYYTWPGPPQWSDSTDLSHLHWNENGNESTSSFELSCRWHSSYDDPIILLMTHEDSSGVIYGHTQFLVLRNTSMGSYASSSNADLITYRDSTPKAGICSYLETGKTTTTT